MKHDSFLFTLMSTAHFYAAQLIGWEFFHKVIYPHFYLAPNADKSLLLNMPIYTLNVLAFGSLVYVATRPIMLLFEYLVQESLLAVKFLEEKISKIKL